jgi:hypothetical protein
MDPAYEGFCPDGAPIAGREDRTRTTVPQKGVLKALQHQGPVGQPRQRVLKSVSRDLSRDATRSSRASEGVTLVIFHAEPDSPSAQSLQLLASMAPPEPRHREAWPSPS